MSGQYLAFIRIDDRQVPLIQYPTFGHEQYPTINEIPYPKTGVDNLPEITLSIWDKKSKQLRVMDIVLDKRLVLAVKSVA